MGLYLNRYSMNKSLFLILFVFFADYALADDIASGFANGTDTFIALFKLTQFVGVIIGLQLCISAVLKLIQIGQNPQISPKTPIFMFIIGVSLIASTSFINLFHSEMFATAPTSVLIDIKGGGSCGQFTGAAMKGVYMFIKAVGMIAFIRGWLLLNQAALGKDGTIGRGLTHIFGGVAAMNVPLVASFLKGTFFPGMPSECFGF